MSRSSEITRADREDRERWGILHHVASNGTQVFHKPWGHESRATWRVYMLLPDPTGACTHERAAMQMREYDRILEHHRDDLSRSEQSQVYARRKRWQRRSEGQDSRFEAMGGVFGGLTNKHRLAQQGGTTPGECLAGLRELLAPELETATDFAILLSDANRYGPPAKTAEPSMVERMERLRRSLGVK